MREHGGYLIAFVDKDEEEIKSGHDGSCHVDVLLEGEEGKVDGKRERRKREEEESGEGESRGGERRRRAEGESGGGERRRRAEGESGGGEGRERREEEEERGGRKREREVTCLIHDLYHVILCYTVLP